MTTQHTPGPWTVDTWDFTQDGKVVKKELIVQDSKNKLATIECDWPELCPRKSVNPYQVPCATAHANARLIAAAPELLERVEWALKVCEGKLDDPDFEGAAENIRTLLAKVRGES